MGNPLVVLTAKQHAPKKKHATKNITIMVPQKGRSFAPQKKAHARTRKAKQSRKNQRKYKAWEKQNRWSIPANSLLVRLYRRPGFWVQQKPLDVLSHDLEPNDRDVHARRMAVVHSRRKRRVPGVSRIGPEIKMGRVGLPKIMVGHGPIFISGP